MVIQRRSSGYWRMPTGIHLVQSEWMEIWQTGSTRVVGVLQGCVLSPLLFNIFLMTMALDNTGVGALISVEVLTDLRFTDDIAMLAEEVDGLQSSLDSFVAVSKKMGMRIYTAMTEIQYLGKGNNRFCLQANS